MVIFAAPYIMPVTITNKEIHAMDKLIHDGALTENGKQELIQIIKKSIEIIEQKKSLEDKEEKDYFDSIEIIPRKKDYKLTGAVALKSLYQFDFFGNGGNPLMWNRVNISFEQNDEYIKTSFSSKDFEKLDVKLKAILFYEMGKPNSFESYQYVAFLKSDPKIEVSFRVYKDDFNRMDHLPRNFYSIKVSKNDSGTNEYPDAKILYLNKK